jgi:multidrug efflux pump
LAVTLGTMVATVILYAVVPKGFFPQQDTGRMNGQIVADQDTSFQAMQAKLGEFVTTMVQDPAVDSANGFLGGTVNTGRVFVGLKDRAKRNVTADQVIARLRGKLARVPGATLYLQSVQDIRVGGRMSATQYQYTLQGDNSDELFQWAPRVFNRLRTLKELADLNSDQQDRGFRPRSRSIAPPRRGSASAPRCSTTRFTTPSASGRCQPCTRNSISTT